MKKFLLIIAVLFCSTALVNAQSTTPRFGITANRDNTARALTYDYKTVTDATGADSIAINPNAWCTIYAITLKDSFALKQPVITRSYLGDNIRLIISAPSGTPFLKFTGSNWKSAGTATLSTGLRAVITFVFDGSKWVEASRVVQ